MRYLSDILVVIGASIITLGIGMMHVPSALIFAGIFLFCFAYIVYKAQKR